MKIKTGDNVILLTGKYEEKFDKNGNIITHKVIAVSPKEDKVIVEGVNGVHKHVKARRQGENSGIVDTNAAVYACKVAIVCPKCGKAARIGSKVTEKGKVRIAMHKECGYPEI